MESNAMDRDAFMCAFRNEHFKISSDDAHEVFMHVLHGRSDLTRELLELLCENYSTTLDDVLNNAHEEESMASPYTGIAFNGVTYEVPAYWDVPYLRESLLNKLSKLPENPGYSRLICLARNALHVMDYVGTFDEVPATMYTAVNSLITYLSNVADTDNHPSYLMYIDHVHTVLDYVCNTVRSSPHIPVPLRSEVLSYITLRKEQ